MLMRETALYVAFAGRSETTGSMRERYKPCEKESSDRKTKLEKQTLLPAVICVTRGGAA